MASRCYCISLRRAARRVSAIYDEALESLGINIGQLSMLRRIERAGPVSLTELGRICELDRSTVGRNAKVLERMQLVRSASGRDQREAMLTLTDAGKATLAAAAPLWDAVQAKIETLLGGEALPRLLSQLEAL